MFLSDKVYPEAENWMEDCSFKFVDFSIRVNDYCQSNAINVEEKDEEHSATSSEIIEDHGSQDEVQKTSEIDQTVMQQSMHQRNSSDETREAQTADLQW